MRKRLPYFFLALGMMQSLHSIEEIITPLYEYFPVVTGYVHSRLAFFPIITMEPKTFVILNILIITALLSLASFVFLEKSWALGLAKIVAAIEILNGCGHVFAAFIIGGYWPGCVSGVVLVILGVLVLNSYKQER